MNLKSVEALFLGLPQRLLGTAKIAMVFEVFFLQEEHLTLKLERGISWNAL